MRASDSDEDDDDDDDGGSDSESMSDEQGATSDHDMEIDLPQEPEISQMLPRYAPVGVALAEEMSSVHQSGTAESRSNYGYGTKC
jgi:hypothetical protein